MTIREMVPPHVVLEAIANNLPVVCFDTCGQGDAVNDKVVGRFLFLLLLSLLVISPNCSMSLKRTGLC